MSDRIRKEAIESEIGIMEKEIVYMKGRRRLRALKEYRKVILHQLKEPIFLRRSE